MTFAKLDVVAGVTVVGGASLVEEFGVKFASVDAPAVVVPLVEAIGVTLTDVIIAIVCFSLCVSLVFIRAEDVITVTVDVSLAVALGATFTLADDVLTVTVGASRLVVLGVPFTLEEDVAAAVAVASPAVASLVAVTVDNVVGISVIVNVLLVIVLEVTLAGTVTAVSNTSLVVAFDATLEEDVDNVVGGVSLVTVAEDDVASVSGVVNESASEVSLAEDVSIPVIASVPFVAAFIIAEGVVVGAAAVISVTFEDDVVGEIGIIGV